MYYPVMLDLTGKKCLVLGGGTVALRKIRSLTHLDVCTYVISPKVHRDIEALVNQHKLIWVERPFQIEDLKDAFIVICATDDSRLNQTAADEAIKMGCLVNVVDQPGVGNFLVPSVVRRGPLVISISTQGASPAFARWMRQRLEDELGPEYEFWLNIMEEYRPKVMSEIHREQNRKKFFLEIVNSEMPQKIKAGMQIEEVLRYLDETLEKYK